MELDMKIKVVKNVFKSISNVYIKVAEWLEINRFKYYLKGDWFHELQFDWALVRIKFNT